MNNIALFRKIMIALLAIATVIVIILVVKNTMMENQLVETEDTKSETPIEIVSNATVISYDENGFSPSSVTAEIGSLIEFTNNGSTTLEIEFIGDVSLNFQELIVSPGESSRSTIVDEGGIYEYRNKDNISQKGTISIN